MALDGYILTSWIYDNLINMKTKHLVREIGNKSVCFPEFLFSSCTITCRHPEPVLREAMNQNWCFSKCFIILSEQKLTRWNGKWELFAKPLPWRRETWREPKLRSDETKRCDWIQKVGLDLRTFVFAWV